MLAKVLLERGGIHRHNLRDAVRVALRYAQEVQSKEQILAALDAQYTQLAVETLQTIARQLDRPAVERDARPTAFGAAFVRAEPNVDRQLVDLVMKIEDVYRRWYRSIEE